MHANQMTTDQNGDPQFFSGHLPLLTSLTFPWPRCVHTLRKFCDHFLSSWSNLPLSQVTLTFDTRLERPEVVGVEAVDDVLRQDLLLLHPVPLVHDELNAEDCETFQVKVGYGLIQQGSDLIELRQTRQRWRIWFFVDLWGSLDNVWGTLEKLVRYYKKKNIKTNK